MTNANAIDTGRAILLMATDGSAHLSAAERGYLRCLRIVDGASARRFVRAVELGYDVPASADVLRIAAREVLRRTGGA